MAPPENSPSGSPSFPAYRPPLLSEDAPRSRTSTPAITPYPLLLSTTQTPPIDDDDNLRARHRRFHGQSQTQPHRAAGDPLVLNGGGDDRVRRIARSTRLRQSLQGNDLQQQQPQQSQAYGPRVPFWRPGQRQSLYDWAPATPPEEGSDSRSLPPLIDGGEPNDEILGNSPSTQQANIPSPLVSVSQSQTRVHRGSGADMRMYESLFGTPIDPTSLMQPAQQNPRRLIRPRFQWHGSSWEREHEREGRDDAFRSRAEWRDAEVMLRSRQSRIRSENYRDPSASTYPSYELEEAIKYLANIRTSSSPEESLRLAVKAGFNRGDDWLRILDSESRYEDLLLDTQFLHVSETSWLKVGGVFWGSQTTPPLVPVVPRRSTLSPTSTLFLPPVYTAVTGPHPDDPGRVTGSASLYYSSNPHHWTVKVIISSIDYSQLHLTGTMEAFTDFQKPSSDKTSITTYLEGEIIDFKTHSLETFNFPSNIKDDAHNWRKLEPFCQLSNEQLVKSLVSRKFMKSLADNWVFMRWKEKCFITPQTSPDVGVLTIGGFYFLSLRRSDGQVQGFYYDPMSQPFQELNLKPRERLFPTYEFR